MYVENMIKTCFRVLLVISLAVIGIGTSVAGGHEKPKVTKSKDVMVLEYEFDDPMIVTQGDIDYVTISGLKMTNKPGAPVIPVLHAQILVPAGMKIEKVTSKAIDTWKLPDTYKLPHGADQFFKSQGPPATPTKPDPDIYSMTRFWPVKRHGLVTVQTDRGYNIAHVNLLPLQYSPKTGKIRTAAKMQLTLRLADADVAHRAKPTKALKKKLKRNLDNPDTIDSYGVTLSRSNGSSPLSAENRLYNGANYKYVVITSSDLAGLEGEDSFQALCNSKIDKGIPAGIVTTEWILATYDGTTPSGGEDDATRIRNFLIDAYQTWGTEYALLGGDRTIIPPPVVPRKWL